MPVPALISDLSIAAGSNSPAGSEAVGTNMDNYLRAHAGFTRSFYGLATSSIASAASIDVAASDAESVSITGSVTIGSLGTGYNGCKRELRFAGTLTLTASANLLLPGGANLTTAAGDVGTFRCIGSGQWVCTAFSSQGASSAFLPLTGGIVTGITQFNAAVIFAGASGIAVSGGPGSFASTLSVGTNLTVGSNITMGGVNVGYRGVPSTIQNTNYTFVAGDAGKSRRKTNASALAYTVNNTVHAADDVLIAHNAGSAGAITITQGAGVTLQLTGSLTTGSRSVAPGGMATILFDSASHAFVSGPGVT